MRRIALLALLALGCGTAPAQAGPLRLLPLHAQADASAGGRIVDSAGRQVVLRGVNVDSLLDYAKPTPFPPTFALQGKDPARMAALGWDAVRLGISWSRIEPRPLAYDDSYLEFVANVVKSMRQRGIYVVLDLHQDGWTQKTGGALGQELLPAVATGWQAFLADAPGPGGLGVQTRYLLMLHHVAERFAKSPSVAGFDVVDEPDALTAADSQRLSAFYARALVAIRSAERSHEGTTHLVFFQPSVLWSRGTRGAPPPFQHDGGVVYAPHLYSGDHAVNRNPFDAAVNEAKAFGGAPVVLGEWGAAPAAIDGGYFSLGLDWQDRFVLGGFLSTWRQSCGDPQLMSEWLAGRVPKVWGEFDVDCRTNTPGKVRAALVWQLSRAYVRAAPGTLGGQVYDGKAGTLAAWGRARAADGDLVAYYPRAKHGGMRFAMRGLADAHVNRGPGGGALISARPRGGPWSLAVAGPR